MLILGQKSCILGPTILKFHNWTDIKGAIMVHSRLYTLSQTGAILIALVAKLEQF